MRSVGTVSVAHVLATEEEAASRDHATSPDLLRGYLNALYEAAVTGRRLTETEKRFCHRRGSDAVEAGVSLPGIVDVYMTASRRMWPRLPELVATRGKAVGSSELVRIGEAMWRAADDALAQLAAGYLEGQRLRVRVEEATRREFVEDLLGNRADVGSLVDRAEPYGLVLTAAHIVAVASTDGAIIGAGQLTGWVEERLQDRLRDVSALCVTKDGRLVCILSSSSPPHAQGRARLVHAVADVAGRAIAELAPGRRWRIGIGRTHAGSRGVGWSYREAVDALAVATRVGRHDPVADAEQLLVYRVLLRDESALVDLLRVVLEPLCSARGGAAPLLTTLEAYFAAGGNAAETARRLHLSVRAVTYRLQRVRELTGYSASDPTSQLPLQVAVAGARLLDWPKQPLAAEES